MSIIGKTFPVLDKGSIQLIDAMPHPLTGVSPDMAIVSAARVSFLGASKGEEKDKRLLFRLMKDKHTSPFEQVTFTFRLHAPLVMFWQHVRHRNASLNFSSGRYTEFPADEFYIPGAGEWRLQSSDNKQASDGLLDEGLGAILTRRMMRHFEEGYAIYQDALLMGVAREQARLFLPGFSAYYTCIWKIDAHNLMHFLNLRMASDAQYEIRAYADIIYREIFKPLMPWTAEAFETYMLKGNPS